MNQETIEKNDNQENDENVVYNIQYHLASFSRRVLANLIDILVFSVVFVSLLLAVRAIVSSTSDYRTAEKTINDVKLESCLFEESKNDSQIKSIVIFYHTSNLYNAEAQNQIFTSHIEGGTCLDQYFQMVEQEGYLSYIKRVSTVEHYNDIVKDYEEYRLSSSFVDNENHPYFIKTNDNVVVNPECKATYLDYVEKVYIPYIDNTLVNTIITCVPSYYNANKYIANMVSFVELPIPYVTAGLFTYILPIFIFKRGRKTWGKALYGIGLISTKDFLIPTKKRTAARFSIFFFGELILSIFTFGIPFILSFSMMAFSKYKQGFPDYMLGLIEVDTHDFKIYFSKDEINLEELNIHKKPVDFRRRGL